MFKFISARDHELMRQVQRWPAPQWIQWWMIGATRGGDGWLWAVLTGIILLFGGEKRIAALAAAGLALVAGVLVFKALKRLTGRKRPCDLEPHCWANLLPPDRFSFPSGHSIMAFAFVTPLALSYPWLRLVLLVCAASVAVSRIVLGMHFLSDVVAGSLLGAGIGYSAFLLLG